MTKKQLTAAEATPHSKGILPFNIHSELLSLIISLQRESAIECGGARRLWAMDGVIGAGRLPSATRYKRVKPESGSKRKDKPKRISRADDHAASGGTNRGTKKRFILAGAATYGGCYSPLTKKQLTAAEATPHSKGILPFNIHSELLSLIISLQRESAIECGGARRLWAMDGVIGAGRLPSATRYKRVKPESGSKRKDKPKRISRAAGIK